MSTLQIVGVVVSIGVGIVGIVVGILKASKITFELEEKRRFRDEPTPKEAGDKPAFAVGQPFPREPRRTLWR